METRAFDTVTFLAMTYTLMVATLSLVGIGFTGYYPGIVVMCLAAVVPIASRYYAYRRSLKYGGRQPSYILLTIVNIVVGLVAIRLTFMNLMDHVFVRM